MPEANPFDRFDKPGGNPFDRFTPPPPIAEQPGSIWQALLGGALHGAGNIGMGVARLFSEGAEKAGIAPSGAGDLVGQAAQQREQQFVRQPTVGAHPTATAIGEAAGEMGASLPISAGRLGTKALEATGLGKAIAEAWGGILSGSLSGAAGGAVGAAARAPTGKGFAPAVAQGAGIGAGLGAGTAAAGAGLKPSAMDAPKVPAAAMVNAPEARTWRDAARTLTSADVRLTPLQSRGASYKERSLQEWPILRSLVRGQVGRSVDDFDRAVVSQALSPIGSAVPRSIRAGHDLVDFGRRQVIQAYDQVLPNLSLTQGGVMQRLQNDPELTKMVSEMAPDDVRRLVQIVQNRVMGRWQGAPQIDGATFKEMERDLAHRAKTLTGGSSDEVGRAINHILGGIRDELETQNPQFAPELQKINQAFSMWARVEAAADRDATARGRFSPDDLLHILKSEDASARGNSFARGREPMQAFAEAGNEVIQPSLGQRQRTPQTFWGTVGNVTGGVVGAPLYGAASLAQRVPGVRQAGEAAAPGVGAVGAAYNEKRRGPLGGRIINQSSIPLGQ